MAQSSEEVTPSYEAVRIPVSSSNVQTITLSVCSACGAFVFNQWRHNTDHDRRSRASKDGGEG